MSNYKKLSKNKVTDFNLDLINFIFKSKYDMSIESVNRLDIPYKIRNLIQQKMNNYDWDVSLLDWLRISNSSLREIKGIGERSVEEYRNTIDNYLIENKINPTEFYFYVYSMKLIDFCLVYNIDLIAYSDAYRNIYKYKYNDKDINKEDENKLKKYTSEILNKYYTETIYSGLTNKFLSDINFKHFTGHSFNEFMEDCFKEIA